MTRTAKLGLLGASSEFAYVRYWRLDSAVARRRVLRRAAQCYLALVTVAAAAAVGGADLRQSLLGSVMAASPRGGETFALYVCLFVLLLFVIPFCIRFGLPATLAVALAWWPVAALLQPLAPTTPAVAYAASRLTGIGAVTGPSVLHSVLLVVIGMAGGRVFLDRSERGWTSARLLLLGVVVGEACVVVASAVALGPVEFVRAFVDITAFRVHNAPPYFAMGALVALGLTILAALALRHGLGGPRRVGPFSRASLLSFTVGNVAINVLLPVTPTPSLAWDGLASCAVIVLLWLGMRADQARRGRRRQRGSQPTQRLGQEVPQEA